MVLASAGYSGKKDIPEQGLKKKDFESDQVVRWCPGCGDYAVLAAVQKTLPEMGVKKENVVFISGIGCSSRFPYYMGSYGFHTIHGRAMPVATGIKVANPELSVWVVTGDGDSMAIGGNHLIHMLRRNPDINVLMFNNRIYGLTKGQYSPTSSRGAKTKSTPEGAIEDPFNPGELVIGSQGSFFARVPDTDVKLVTEVLSRAQQHKGTSFIEILQNCVIFNDKIHEDVAGRKFQADHQLRLKHGEPLVFGKENNKGIRLNNLKPEVVTPGENGVKEEDLLVHDAHNPNPLLHGMLARLARPDFPVAMGVIRDVKSHVYEQNLYEQIKERKAGAKIHSVDDLLNSGVTWDVEEKDAQQKAKKDQL